MLGLSCVSSLLCFPHDMDPWMYFARTPENLFYTGWVLCPEMEIQSDSKSPGLWAGLTVAGSTEAAAMVTETFESIVAQGGRMQCPYTRLHRISQLIGLGAVLTLRRKTSPRNSCSFTEPNCTQPRWPEILYFKYDSMAKYKWVGLGLQLCGRAGT